MEMDYVQVPALVFIYKKMTEHIFSMCIDASWAGDAVESGEERAGAARANRLAAWGAGHIKGLRARPQRA